MEIPLQASSWADSWMERSLSCRLWETEAEAAQLLEEEQQMLTTDNGPERRQAHVPFRCVEDFIQYINLP